MKDKRRLTTKNIRKREIWWIVTLVLTMIVLMGWVTFDHLNSANRMVGVFVAITVSFLVFLLQCIITLVRVKK